MSRYSQHIATVAQAAQFDDIIDARSPSEFALDHLPAALSCPVLSDAERMRVGTLYAQDSAFAARRLGAALVAKNIGGHIEALLQDKAKSWRPLIYCWRGGKRSGAFVHILREVGWDAHQLLDGYKAWRRQVISELEALPSRFTFHVLTGATGSGKSRVLEAINHQGGQILHLEQLACHRGSLLGALPQAEGQPSQRLFESRLYTALRALDSQRTVYVEAESRRIGALSLPTTLLKKLRLAPCSIINASLEARVEFLCREYDHFLREPRPLYQQLERMRSLLGHSTIDHWRTLIAQGDFFALVRELLDKHYDPHYRRSQAANYPHFANAKTFVADTLNPLSITHLATQIQLQ